MFERQRCHYLNCMLYDDYTPPQHCWSADLIPKKSYFFVFHMDEEKPQEVRLMLNL